MKTLYVLLREGLTSSSTFEECPSSRTEERSEGDLSPEIPGFVNTGPSGGVTVGCGGCPVDKESIPLSELRGSKMSADICH